MGKASWGAALGWLFCLLTGKVYAQGLPAATQNAQELQRQQQREQELRQKLQVQPTYACLYQTKRRHSPVFRLKKLPVSK